MRSRKNRFSIAAAMTLGGGLLFAGPGTGCASYVVESALATADFCFIFDCQNGILGGTIDPCPPLDDLSGEAVLSPPSGPIFVDCPEISGP
jgi:hypothetical protein